MKRSKVSPLDWMKGKKQENEVPEGDLASKCTTYYEHTMTIEELAARHTESHINIEQPKKSGGLDTATAAARLAEYGPVCVHLLSRIFRARTAIRLPIHRIVSLPARAHLSGRCF